MATETVLNKLTINSVESREVYKKMQEKGLINEDEIYLVSSDDAGEDVPSTTSLIKGNGSGGLVAAVAGTDYVTPESMATAIQTAIQNTWEASY